MTQEKLTDKAIDDALQAANDVILALAGEHEEVSPCDNKKMVELWDDLNDRYAPPALVRAMALELQEHRKADKWIDFRYESPEAGQKCLIHTSAFGIIAATCVEEPGEKYFIDSLGNEFKGGMVEYWKPAPKIPTERQAQ